MKIGSLFSGIGGLELGLEQAIPGSHTVWQVEQNEYAQRVLAKHWPEVQRYDDVKQVGTHNLESVDIMCGGFPCQDLSVAGKQAGIDGKRSGLWTEYARIIGELEPRFVVVENVAALLAQGMGRVLGDLATLGYDAIWDCIPAAAVRAHHRRDRIFIVAWSQHRRFVADSSGRRGSKNELCSRGDESGVCGSSMADTNSKQQQCNHNGRSRTGGSKTAPSRSIHIGDKGVGGRAETMADTIVSRLEGHRRPNQARKICRPKTTGMFSRSLRHVTDWEPEPSVGRVAHGIPRRVDRLKCIGNAVVPQVGQVIGRVIVELDGVQ